MTAIPLPFTPSEAAAVRPLAIRGYDEARARGWPFLSDVLEGALRGAPEADRASATALAQALVRYDRLLAFACGSASSDARCDALLSLSSGATNVDARLARIADPTERLGTRYSMPDALVDLLRAELGEPSLERALARMNEPAPRVARVNTLKTTRDACLDALAREDVAARPTTCSQVGLTFEGQRSLFRTGAFARGELESQDEASQLVAELVAPPPKSFAIDACAGAGGKTLALAAAMGGKGKIVAIDASPSKIDELRRRARRAGASDVQALVVDLLEPAAALVPFEGRASRVLVDAPCTGLGAIRRNPEARWRFDTADLERMVRAQRALCDVAARLVAPHGRLVYATCSFLPSEGEAATAAFLEAHPEFAPVTVRDVLGRARSEPVATPDGKYLRTWRFDGTPDGGDLGMDGFFASVVRRREGASEVGR